MNTMFQKRRERQNSVSRALAFLFCLAICSPTIARNQESSRPERLPYAANPANVPTALSRLQNKNYSPVDLEILARYKAKDALPALRSEFAASHDPDTTEKIANALVRIGDHDPQYWDFLTARATAVLARDTPNPYGFSDGKAVSDPPQEFSRWAADHNIQLAAALERATFSDPGTIANLAMTGDRRALPLLRRALQSRNYFVVAAAALGLAELQDKDSIPLIVDSCRQAPKETAELIAQSLVYFDTPEAQQAVDTFIPKERANALKAARGQGVEPF
jgi:HEAT repeat protein